MKLALVAEGQALLQKTNDTSSQGSQVLQECLIIGHRGAAGLAPENTMLSYRTALDLGVPMIELDIHETIDGHLVCIHDSSVDRATDGSGIVAEMTLREIRGLDAGLGERVPLLSEVLDLARGRMSVNIELKALGVEKKVLDLVTDRSMLDSIIVSSFYHGSILAMKELNPNVPTSALIAESKEGLVSYVVDLGADALNPLHSLVTHDLVEEAHRKSLRIYPWTVNDASRMFELLRLGVDGIITDFPNVGLDVLSEFST